MKRWKRIMAGLLMICLCLFQAQHIFALSDFGNENESWETTSRMDSVKKLYTTCKNNGTTSEMAVIDRSDNLWMTRDSDMEKMVKVMTNVSEVVFGYEHYAVICKDHSLWMWGRNDYGQIGNGTVEYQERPVKIMDDVEKVQLFSFSSAAIQSDGSLWGWGDNFDNRFGTDTGEEAVLSPFKMMDNVKKVSFAHPNFILQNDGTLWGWGSNENYLLGYQFEEEAKVSGPTQLMTGVSDFCGAADCAPGQFASPGTTAVVKNDGSLWTWGGYALRGVKPKERIDEPMKILEHVKKVTIGTSNAAVITEDGNLYVWGRDIGRSLLQGVEISEENDEVDLEARILVPKILLTNIKDFFMAPDNAGNDIDNGYLYECMAIEEDGTLLTWRGGILTPTAILENAAQAGYMGYTENDDCDWKGVAVKEDGSFWVWNQDEEPVEFGVSQSGSGIFYRREEITEDDLYGEHYKYLYNKSYDRIYKKLVGDMSSINADRTGWENACSVLVSNMKNGAAASVVNSAISFVTGKYYNQNKLEQEIALEYLQTIAEDDTILQDVTDKLSKEFKWTSKTYKIISSGFKSYSEKKELAKAMAGGMYTESAALDLIRSCETHWDEIDDIFKKGGKIVKVTEVVAMIIIARQTDKELISSLMGEVEKDSALYRGLQSIEKIQKRSPEKLITELIKNGGFEKITDILSDHLVGNVSSLLGGTGGIQIGAVATLAGIGYSVLGSAIGTYYASSDNVVKAIISVSNVSQLDTALSRKFQVIAENYNTHGGIDTQTLKSEYSMLYKAYIVALKSAVDAVSKVALDDSYKESLLNNYKKYNSLLTYEKYIKSCLKNANHSWNYTYNQGNATITGTGSSQNERAGAGNEEGQEDVYALDIPDEIDGYTVTEIGDAVFQDDRVSMVYIPGTVTKVGNDSFKDCINLLDIFLEKEVETIGEGAFPSVAAASVLPAEAVNMEIIQMPEKLSYTMSELKTPDETDVENGKTNCIDTNGLIVSVTYSDGTVKEIEGMQGYIREKALGEALVDVYYDGQSASYPIQVTADECSYTISYQDEAGNEIREGFSGTAAAGEIITVSAPQIDGYTADEDGREEIIGADNDFVMTYHRIPEPSVDDADIIYRDSYKYTGSAITPGVTVKYGDELLTENTDYVVEYENNRNPGTAAIIVAGIGKYKGIVRKEFSILKPPVLVKKISVSGVSAQIAAGRKIQLKAVASPSNAANRGVVWSSSNRKVATVDAKGLVTVKKKTGGKSVIITAKAKDGSGIQGRYKITSMAGAVKQIKVTGKKSLKAGRSLKLKAKVTTTKGKANKKVVWTSNKPKIAAVSASGKVTAMKGARGTVKITATSTDGTKIRGTINIKVN